MSEPSQRVRSVSPSALLSLAAALSMGLAVESAAQEVERGEFVILRGSDTVLVERITRTATRVRAVATHREQGTSHLSADIQPDGFFSSVEVRRGDSTGAPMLRLGFRGDTVLVSENGGAERRIVTASRVLPHLQWSVAGAEQLVRRVRAVGGAAVEVPLLLPDGNAMPVRVARQAPGVLRATYPDNVVIDFRVDEATGRLTGGCVPSENLTVMRIGEAKVSCPLAP